MIHWCQQYIGQPYSPEKDCFGWFRHWRKEHFGQELAPVEVNQNRRVRHAIEIMQTSIHELFGWRRTNTPEEGDMVYLARGRNVNHLGMVVFVSGRFQALHAIEGTGVCLSDNICLLTNGWEKKGYYTCR